MVKNNDSTFLSDAVSARKPKANVTYLDGFRFGIGATVGVFLVFLLVGLIAWGIIASFNLH